MLSENSIKFAIRDYRSKSASMSPTLRADVGYCVCAAFRSLKFGGNLVDGVERMGFRVFG